MGVMRSFHFPVLALVVFCFFISEGTRAAKPKRPLVFVDQVKKTEIFDLLSYPARLTSKINASILSESEGVVVAIKRPLGTPVKRGQEVLRVQHTDPVFQYAPVRVQSPVKGVVSSVDVTIGSQVKKGQKLATVTDPKKTRVIIEVAASDLMTIQPGLTGDLKLTGWNETVPVTVTGVSPFVDPGTGTATAELVLTQKDLVLPPGLVGRVNFKVRAHPGFQIPEDAVVYRGKDTFLRLVNDGKAKLTPVSLGATRRGIVEILEGLTEGATVVVRASQFITDGEEVDVEQTKQKKTRKN